MKKIVIFLLISSTLWIFSSVSADSENTLSQNDKSLYEKIQKEFGPSFVSNVDVAIEKYKDRMNMLRWSKEKKFESHNQTIQKVNLIIQDLLMQYPQDDILPKNVNQRYFILSYIKFELIMLDFMTEDTALRERLTETQYEVTQNWATEKPFTNKYHDNFEEGIYVDIVDGTALFSSTDKFKTNTGWPAFAKPLSIERVKELEDLRYNMVRTEVKAAQSDSHLWHIFTDGPTDLWGLRYCINSASLKFIPKEDLEWKGYWEYLSLFE